ncbi:radical SAM additional 4Fe4S-binding SPASM domain-containing protein [Butyrivibrio sp. INlla18]|uniref:radical SAM/SPASM domain-containing protein n=1 Tax=Butyrivibrio sp. INlla18 TaxID=1520806 RepID=UPI00088735FA|nr:radical SAM protein [Butyrivibrio sp. INlla18]SDA69963.1 radical SAM additional 4Fe4S-binding SPASM domain-containing protein [Butyrivibrio sp. INlla18]
MNHVQIEMSDRCNFQCKFCEIKNHRNYNDFPIDKFYDIIDQLERDELPGGKIFMVSLSGVGEPLMHKDIVKAVAYAKSKFPFVGFITNGFFLTPDKVDQLLECDISYITISLNGVDAKVYEKFQGYGLADPEGTMNRVIENIKYLLKRRDELGKKTEVRIPYIVTEDSEEHVSEFIKYWKDNGHEVLIHLKRLLEWHDVTKNKLGRCERLMEDFMIYANGDVTICAVDQSRGCILGNAFEKSIKEILEGEKYQSIIKANRERRFQDLPEICKRCEYIIDDGFLKNNCDAIKVLYLNNPLKNFKWKFYTTGQNIFSEFKKHDLTWEFYKRVKNRVMRREYTKK